MTKWGHVRARRKNTPDSGRKADDIHRKQSVGQQSRHSGTDLVAPVLATTLERSLQSKRKGSAMKQLMLAIFTLMTICLGLAAVPAPAFAADAPPPDSAALEKRIADLEAYVNNG